jgi:hypothetical protein
LNLKEEFEKKRRRRTRGRIGGDAKQQELSPPNFYSASITVNNLYSFP